MKNHLLSLISCLFSLFYFISCSNDLQTPSSNATSDIDIQGVISEYDRLGTEIHDFGSTNTNTRSKREALTINWSDYRVFKSSTKVVFDIRLQSRNNKIIEKIKLSNVVKKNWTKNVSTRLIYENYHNNQTRFYIVTQIDSKEDGNSDNWFYRNDNFTGTTIISDFTGKVLAVYNVKNGVQKEATFAFLNEIEHEEDLPEVQRTIEKEGLNSPMLLSLDVTYYQHHGKLYREGEIAYCDICALWIICGEKVTECFDKCLNPDCGRLYPPGYGGFCVNCGSFLAGSVIVVAICDLCRNEKDLCSCCEECHRPICICCRSCGHYPCSCSGSGGGSEPPRCSNGHTYCNGSCVGGGGSSGGGNPDPDPDPEPQPECFHVICGECELPINISTTRSIPSCGHSESCKCWWGSGHNKLMEDALGQDLTEAQLDAVKKGSKEADQKQKVEDAYRHAMVETGKTLEEAKREMREHFVTEIENYKLSNNYESLGHALHLVQDIFSPAHSLKDWDGSIISYIPHIFEGRIFNRPEFNDALAATITIFEQISQCESNNESIGSVFDDFLRDFERKYAQ